MKDSSLYPFGLEKDKIIKELRLLADYIETGSAVPQSAMTSKLFQDAEYSTQTLSVTFVAKINGKES